jgi:zinc transport system substrate-binding protein
MRYIISSAFATLATTLPAFAEVPRVVTDIHPVHALVAQVMGDLGTPELLLSQGASEHEFQLRPSQAAGLAEAELVVWIGPELTPWLDRALDGLGEGSARLTLLQVEGTELRDFSKDGSHAAEDAHDHGHEEKAVEAGHDHGHEEAAHDDHAHDGHSHDGHSHDEASHDDHAHDDHAHDEHGHSHEGTDPHAWLDPANARLWLTAIADELSRLDPENATTYAANAETAAAEIAALDAEIATLLAPVQGKPLVVYHDAYGYFAAHYGLEIFGSIALGDATAPGAARLSELRDGVAAGTPVCLFPEAQHDPALVQQLADGTGSRIGGALDPNGSTLEPGKGAYTALLRNLAETMVKCVQTS